MKNQLKLGLLALATVALTLASCGSVGSGSSGGDMQGANHGEGEDARGKQDGPKKASGGTHGGTHGDMAGMDGGSTDGGATGMVMENGEYSDKAFIDAMIPHHRGAVEMAEVALENAEHRQVRSLADNVVTTQKAEVRDLESIRRREYGTAGAPKEMSPEDMQTMGMTDPGRLARQRPFDKAFIDAMIPHHRSAIEMAQVAREETENPEVREIATNIVSAQEREISQMKRWREQWYPRDRGSPVGEVRERG